MSGFIAYLLDPSAATLRAVRIQTRLIVQSMRFLVGCERLAPIAIDDRHTAFVDGDGLHKAATGIFTVVGREDLPIPGRAIIVADDPKHQDACSPFLSLEAAAHLITVHRPIVVPRLVGHAASAIASSGALSQMSMDAVLLQLQRVRPTVCDG